ncbi:4'-phosphopantetheinyl transferase family protein [Paenibacillus polymyxa]|uniref:4'-phosphopantetheinyl transferase family protein n=1 Tax=Paenibacillus polymyxa TaxID=1406 RepID=UPI0032171213
MSNERYVKVQKYKFDNDKIRSVLVYLLLRIGLLKEFYYKDKPGLILQENGKPGLADASKIKFNMSHCKKAVACAISKYEVGIDVQELVVYDEGLGKTVLSNREKKFVEHSADKNAAFTRLWAQKESYGKYMGCGIVYDLKSTEFNDDRWIENNNECVTTIEEFADFVLATYSLEHLDKQMITYDDLLYYIGFFEQADD